MFLAVNYATGTLKCDNLIVILHLFYVLVESWPVSSVGQRAQPSYRLKASSKSTMGTDCLNGLAFAYVHDINPESTLQH